MEAARHPHRGAIREQQLPPRRRSSCRSTSPRSRCWPRPRWRPGPSRPSGWTTCTARPSGCGSRPRRSSACCAAAPRCPSSTSTGAEAERAVVVARFLAVLELYRLGAIGFEQVDPLGALVVRWIAQDWDDTMLARLGGGFERNDDGPAGTPQAHAAGAGRPAALRAARRARRRRGARAAFADERARRRPRPPSRRRPPPRWTTWTPRSRRCSSSPTGRSTCSRSRARSTGRSPWCARRSIASATTTTVAVAAGAGASSCGSSRSATASTPAPPTTRPCGSCSRSRRPAGSARPRSRRSPSSRTGSRSAAAQIAAIRAVSVDSVLKTLVARGLVAEVGRSEETGAVLYGTTDDLLVALGIRSLGELPPLAPLLEGVRGCPPMPAELTARRRRAPAEGARRRRRRVPARLREPHRRRPGRA